MQMICKWLCYVNKNDLLMIMLGKWLCYANANVMQMIILCKWLYYANENDLQIKRPLWCKMFLTSKMWKNIKCELFSFSREAALGKEWKN